MKTLIQRVTGCFLLLFITFTTYAQQQKLIRHNSHAWLSFNSTIKLKGKFGLIADVHVRRNNFLSDANFNFARAAINYWHTEKLTMAAGYAHMWIAPSVKGYKTYADEHWVYQQVQNTSKIGRVSFTQRLRNELKWQEVLVEDKNTNRYRFCDRVSVLASATVPLSRNDKLPSVVFSNELLIHFGKYIVYNSFDQNWAFAGLKQKLTQTLSFDIGYMLVYQQKSAGYIYDMNDTFRMWFYYNPDWRKKNKKS